MAVRIVASCIPMLILTACADPPNNPVVNASASNAAYFASPSGASYMPPMSSSSPTVTAVFPVPSAAVTIVPPTPIPTASATTTTEKGPAKKTK